MARLSKILGYEVLGTLGQGARSTIYAVQDSELRLFALKHVVREGPQDQRFIDQAVTEHEVASQFDHPNLRKSLKLIRQRKLMRTSDVFVLMELVDGATLEKSAQSSVVHLCRLCLQVAGGMAAMHERGYVHADMKPNNVMVTDDGNVKIIDFGQSCKSGTIKPRIQGTPDYIAPEQVQRMPITPRTDVFNLGATMYWLFTGKHVPTMIPKGEPGTMIRQEHVACPPPHEINDQIPPALSSLVMHCIEAEVDRRPATMRSVGDRIELAIAQFERNQNQLRQSG